MRALPTSQSPAERPVSEPATCWMLALASAGVAAVSFAGAALTRIPQLDLLVKLVFLLSGGTAALLLACSLLLPRRVANALSARWVLLAMTCFFLLTGSELAVRVLFRGVSTTADNRSYFARRWNDRHVRLNSLGYREREFSRERTPGVLRVGVVGDSFAFGQGVEESERFSNRIEAQLGRGFEVLNFGWPGDETVDELRKLREAVLPTKPDAILLEWFVNDVEGADKSDRPQPTPLWNHPSRAVLQQHSALYYLLNQQWLGLQAQLHPAESYSDFMKRKYGDSAGPGMQEFRRVFHEFSSACAAAGIDLSVVLFPAIEPDMAGNYGFAFLHEQMREICRQESLECLDLLPRFAEAPGGYGELRLNVFDEHASAAANELAAGAILEAFAARWRALAERGAIRGAAAP